MTRHILVALVILASSLASAQTKPVVTIKFFVGERQLEAGEGVNTDDMKQLNFKILTDGVVSTDVTYQILWRMYLRKGTELGAPIEGKGLNFNLGAFMSTAKPGDALAFEVDHVTRTGADGHRELVALSSSSKYLSVPVKK